MTKAVFKRCLLALRLATRSSSTVLTCRLIRCLVFKEPAGPFAGSRAPGRDTKTRRCAGKQGCWRLTGARPKPPAANCELHSVSLERGGGGVATSELINPSRGKLPTRARFYWLSFSLSRSFFQIALAQLLSGGFRGLHPVGSRILAGPSFPVNRLFPGSFASPSPADCGLPGACRTPSCERRGSHQVPAPGPADIHTLAARSRVVNT